MLLLLSLMATASLFGAPSPASEGTVYVLAGATLTTCLSNQQTEQLLSHFTLASVPRTTLTVLKLSHPTSYHLNGSNCTLQPSLQRGPGHPVISLPPGNCSLDPRRPGPSRRSRGTQRAPPGRRVDSTYSSVEFAAVAYHAADAEVLEDRPCDSGHLWEVYEMASEVG